MSTLPLTVDEMTEAFEQSYDTPLDAHGQCWKATDLLVSSFDMFEWIGADHSNSPLERYDELNQFGNHFAAYHYESDLIIDFTFRQFDEEAPYPLICPREEWIERLAYVWETDSVRTAIGYTGLDFDESDFDDPGDYGDFLDALEFWDFTKPVPAFSELMLRWERIPNTLSRRSHYDRREARSY